MGSRSALLRRTTASLAIAAGTLALVAAIPASASGPAAHGKQILTLDCDGLGTVTIAAPLPEKAQGSGQIVGTKGHITPTSFVFDITDLTTNTLIFTDTTIKGGGNANANQDTTTCSGVVVEAPASAIFGPDLPPGVGPDDVIRVSATITVVAKP
jgi:hypothetical protein